MSDTKTSEGAARRVVVAQEQLGWRLDRFLAVALGDVSRSRVSQLLEAGAVTHTRKTIKDGNFRVKPGEAFTVEVPVPSVALPQGQDIALEVVFEDKDLIVINKPAGLVVHPAAGNPDGTLVNALIAHCGSSLLGIGGEMRPGIVHRLDKDTSGLLVAAKNERTMVSLAKQFANHTVERAYHAVVWGAPHAGNAIVEGQIGRNPFDRKRMAVLRGGGKKARTRYRVIETFGDPSRPIASLVECRLETGRTHQIRVHLTHIGHPLIGDPTYGRAHKPPRPKTTAQEVAFELVSNFSRQALHAWLLGFQHPSLHRTLRFEKGWPADMNQLITALRSLKN